LLRPLPHQVNVDFFTARTMPRTSTVSSEVTIEGTTALKIDVDATIEKIFKVFDQNGDGSLDKQELSAFAKAFTKPTKAHQRAPKGQDNIDKAMDFEDGDGNVQLAEFKVYLEAVLAAKFAEYDNSHDGILTIDEMTKVVNDLCHSKADERQRKQAHYMQNKKEWFMTKFDKDHGDSVSLFEFQAFFLKEMDAVLRKWKPGQELPYILRAAVNVNPGQVHKLVQTIEKVEEKRVEKSKAAGVYISPEQDAFHVADVTDKKDLQHFEAPELTYEEKFRRAELAKEEARKHAAPKQEAPENAKAGILPKVLVAAAVVAIGVFAYKRYSK